MEKRAKILLIDDDPDFVEVTKKVLEKGASYQVVVAVNGKEGLEKAKKEKPDLILLDILMPVTDGFGFAEQFSKERSLRNIPVLALTSFSTSLGEPFAFEVAEFIRKPVGPRDLLERIDKHLKRAAEKTETRAVKVSPKKRPAPAEARAQDPGRGPASVRSSDAASRPFPRHARSTPDGGTGQEERYSTIVVSPFKEAIEAVVEAGGKALKQCYQCGLCTGTCPWNLVKSFPTRKLIHQSQLGVVDFESEDTWTCATCRACVARCPRGVAIIDIMKALRGVIVGMGAGYVPGWPAGDPEEYRRNGQSPGRISGEAD